MTTTNGRVPAVTKMPFKIINHILYRMPFTSQVRNPHRIVAAVVATQNIIQKRNKVIIFAIIICVLETGIVLIFLNVSLSLSIKKSMAAITPITQGSKN